MTDATSDERFSITCIQAARVASIDDDTVRSALDAVFDDPHLSYVGVVVWACVATRPLHGATLKEILRRLPGTPRSKVVCALRSLVAGGHLTSSMAPRGEGQ